MKRYRGVNPARPRLRCAFSRLRMVHEYQLAVGN